MKKILSAAAMAALLLSVSAGALAATGLGSVTEVSNTAATADKAGSVSVDTTMCAVELDDEGKIVSISFDVVQSSAAYDATGAVSGEETAEPLSKVELKEDYGMKKASAIGKEWYEQMTALESWCIGKTVEEILATPLDESGKATDADLVSGCTVHINAQLKALEKAAANAK